MGSQSLYGIFHEVLVWTVIDTGDFHENHFHVYKDDNEIKINSGNADLPQRRRFRHPSAPSCLADVHRLYFHHHHHKTE